ncbi:uncharacterized protein LOC134533134 [Bacillus rossius redtenbacheri]|uniref:uncharacterized protein LOC134533134 n=1 Tax=Bacillus rossius redtenbacheri TaxID=93214 RepID=UPI002FDD3961
MARRKGEPRSSSTGSPLQSRSSRSTRSGDDNRQPRNAPALREIKRLQNTTNLLIPRKSFQDVVRSIVLRIVCQHHFTGTIRWSVTAMEALQEAAEAYLVNFFEDALLCTLHARRVTLMVKDFELTRRMRGPNDVANR